MRKTRAIKFKIQENHVTVTSIQMFSPEFNLKENSATVLFYLLKLQLKHKMLLFAGRLRRKLKDWIYVT